MSYKRILAISITTAVTLSVAVLLLHLYERGMVAQIVNDERAWDLRDASPREEVIVSRDGMIARYLTENKDEYIGEIQDTVRFPRRSSKVETWYASDGKGIVSLKEPGEAPAYAEPDSTARVVGKLIFEYGYCPDCYDCLGLMDGWFKVRLSGAEGYIREEYVNWDAIDSM